MDSPSRREVLGAVTAIGATAVTGCLADNPEVEGGHLFLENEREVELRALLTVSDRDADEQVVGGEYRLPARTVAQFSEVLVPGNTYGIRVFQPSADDSRGIVTGAETCDPDDPSDRLDVVVILTGDGPRITVQDCDSNYTQRGELTYDESPSEFRIGDVTGTVPAGDGDGG